MGVKRHGPALISTPAFKIGVKSSCVRLCLIPKEARHCPCPSVELIRSVET